MKIRLGKVGDKVSVTISNCVITKDAGSQWIIDLNLGESLTGSPTPLVLIEKSRVQS